jgi:hypothetical protein
MLDEVVCEVACEVACGVVLMAVDRLIFHEKISDQ